MQNYEEKNQEQNLEKENVETKEESTQSNALQACQQELASLKDTCMRVTADFENAKKRMEREKQQWVRIAQAEVLVELLPVIDDFERAIAEKEREDMPQELEPWFEGFLMINKEFHKYLKKMGIMQIETAVFNPEFHEAVMSVEADKPSGEIVDVYEKGYLFKEHVLRPAKVSVAK